MRPVVRGDGFGDVVDFRVVEDAGGELADTFGLCSSESVKNICP